MGQLDLGAHCQKLHTIDAALRAGDVVEALRSYLCPETVAVCTAAVEWRLAHLTASFQGSIDAPSDAAWPEHRLHKPSGAVLFFVLAQGPAASWLRSDLFPPGLTVFPALPTRRKKLVADAWLRRPTCSALADPRLCQRFAEWLAEHRPNLGTCLLAAAARGDDPSWVAKLGALWLEQGLAHPGAPEQVLCASAVPALAELARQALDRCVALFFESTEILLRLLAAGVRLGATAATLALSEALLGRELDVPARREVLAARLAALADGRRHRELAEEYRRRWQPLGGRYPWPEKLLYRFQELGDDELERHLLGELEPGAETPRWVLLTRETSDGMPRARQLEAWGTLYAESPRDERVLVGITRVLLRCPGPVRREWVERLGLRRRWEQLAVHGAYRELASAYLVLLHTEDEDRILEFEARLASVSVTAPAARRAARAYLAALRRTKQWQRLRGLEAEGAAMLYACPFEEREQIRLMARLHELPEPRRVAERDWCAGWESLISLPMTESEVLETIEHFVNLSQELELRGHLQCEPEFFEDVRLQVLRRAKAVAETLLGRSRAAASEDEKRRCLLARAGVAATYDLLRELKIAIDTGA